MQVIVVYTVLLLPFSTFSYYTMNSTENASDEPFDGQIREEHHFEH